MKHHYAPICVTIQRQIGSIKMALVPTGAYVGNIGPVRASGGMWRQESQQCKELAIEVDEWIGKWRKEGHIITIGKHGLELKNGEDFIYRFDVHIYDKPLAMLFKLMFG